MGFALGTAIGSAVGGLLNSGNAGGAAGASLDAVRLTTQVSRELHEYWKAYYKSCDAAAIAEVCAIPKYVAPSQTLAGRTRLEVIRTIGRKRQQLYRGQNVYHTGKMAQDCNVLAALEATAAIDASEYGYRRGQNLEIQRNQRRLENIYAYLGLGRNLLSNSLAAAGLGGAIAAQIGAQQGKNVAGWSQFLGYLQTKQGRGFLDDLIGGAGRVFAGDPTGEGAGAEGALAQTIGGAEGTGNLGDSQPATETTPDAAPAGDNTPMTGASEFGLSYGGGGGQ